jgi:L-ascorbate metabolism protein UlaG (beta-lactamase superfamily)
VARVLPRVARRWGDGHHETSSERTTLTRRKEIGITMANETDRMDVQSVATAPDVETGEPSSSRSETGSLFFIGTATVLFRLGPFTVLTDPNFLHQGESVGLGYGLLRSKRLTEPAISIDQLPPLDMVVLSHHHEDHFDRVATERLDRSVPILTTPDAARALTDAGFRNALTLNTWQQESFVRGDWLLTVTALPGKHGPAFMLPFLPSVMGSLLDLRRLDSSESLRIYVSGDTLPHDHLREIPARFPGIDLALVHLGGTRIFGVLLTMDGRQGVEALRLVRPETAVPIHYDDYDVFKSPLDDFRDAVRAAGLEQRVRYVARGETVPLPSPTRKASA